MRLLRHEKLVAFSCKRRGFCPACGAAITLIQRFGSAANLNIHLHCLVLEGTYRTTEGVAVFHAVRAPTAAEPQALLLRIIKRLMNRMHRDVQL